jgi:hypothetical protein
MGVCISHTSRKHPQPNHSLRVLTSFALSVNLSQWQNFETAMIVVGCVAAGWALLVFIVAMGACCSGQGVAFYG